MREGKEEREKEGRTKKGNEYGRKKGTKEIIMK
jgi:hypothetical protein